MQKTERIQARRARNAARAALLAQEAAARAEATAEEQAPRQQRIATDLRGPLAVPDVRRGGYRRANPLWQMHCTNPTVITARHVAAARRLNDDCELGCGARRGGDGERVDGATALEVPMVVLDAIGRYRAACAALGVLTGAVLLVAIEGWTVGRLAERAGLSAERASGYLIAGLDLLVDHYWPESERRCG